MKPLHYFYLTRWAFRNDPALGWVMGVPLLFAFEYHYICRCFHARMKGYILEAIITQSLQ